jgi:hypothetical protein
MENKKQNSLVEILKNAKTLEKAFKVLESKNLLFLIENVKNSTEKILLAQKDYAIVTDSYRNNEKIHPYGREIVYNISEQKK